jgi:hypothetical protein
MGYFYSVVRPHMESSELDPAPLQTPLWIQVVGTLRAAEYHWHFSQGIRALESDLYIPGVLSLLTGIEASLRFTLYRKDSEKYPFEGDLGPVLSNGLLRAAREQGLPVELLAFADDTDFLALLRHRKPEVKIVQIRNDLAHGNIQRYINRELGDKNAFFTPECLREVAHELQAIALRWSNGLAGARSAA